MPMMFVFGLLVSFVVAIRPPMPFSRENADLLFDTLDQVLADTPLAP